VKTDSTIASVTGDLREYLAPGTSFRIGGSEVFDGAELVGSTSTASLSPALSNVQLTSQNHLFVGEKVRVAADAFSIAKKWNRCSTIDCPLFKWDS
jgi:hypothetical protein